METHDVRVRFALFSECRVGCFTTRQNQPAVEEREAFDDFHVFRPG
jgi:hypothetical protein